MKPRLQTSLGQQLVLTPQLRQALHLLQLSALELEAEINAAVESNPLLDWDESEPLRIDDGSDAPTAEAAGDGEAKDADRRDDDWGQAGEAWQESRGWQGDDGDDPADRMVQTDSLQDHLSWQLHLTHMSERDRRIGLMLIDAIDDDGYLRDALDAIAQSLLPEIQCTPDEVLAV
ncbi:MAG: RNA polymerase factor sigma-54, partial [Luteimonas sp.]|nr:RNA polymerase factor sigma-54 [Luteimonas sp.]